MGGPRWTVVGSAVVGSTGLIHDATAVVVEGRSGQRRGGLSPTALTARRALKLTRGIKRRTTSPARCHIVRGSANRSVTGGWGVRLRIPHRLIRLRRSSCACVAVSSSVHTFTGSVRQSLRVGKSVGVTVDGWRGTRTSIGRHSIVSCTGTCHPTGSVGRLRCPAGVCIAGSSL